MRVICPPQQKLEAGHDVVGELTARLTEVLAENTLLKSQPVRKEVMQVQVPQYIDRPETVAKVAVLERQILELNSKRLKIAVDAAPQKTPVPAPVVQIQEKVIDRIVEKVPTRAWALLIAACVACMGMGLIAGKLLH